METTERRRVFALSRRIRPAIPTRFGAIPRCSRPRSAAVVRNEGCPAPLGGHLPRAHHARPVRRSLQVADESVATTQRNRQNWALGMSETWKGPAMLQLGRLSEAVTSLEGHSAGAMQPDRAVLGRPRWSRSASSDPSGDDRGVREVRISCSDAECEHTGVRRHAAWCLALCAMFEGRRSRCTPRLCTRAQMTVGILPLPVRGCG